MCTAPTVPSLDASHTLIMAEALKSGQGSSLSTAAPSVIGPSASDTTLPSSSSTYFTPKYSLPSICDADLRCLNIFKTNPDSLKSKSITISYCVKSITITVSCASQGALLCKMTSLLGTPSQFTFILPVSTLGEWSPVPYFIIWRLRTSWRACHSNVFARCLESPCHRTHASCLLMFLLLLHFWLCPGHTVSVRTAYPLRLHCCKCQHYCHLHLACKSKQAVCGCCNHALSDGHSPKTCSR